MAEGIMSGGRAVFRIRDYSLYCASRFLWGIGHHVQTITIAWLIYELTHDPLKLGLIGLVAFGPAVPLALVAGPAADRYDRRTIIILCSVVMAATSIAMIAMIASGFRLATSAGVASVFRRTSTPASSTPRRSQRSSRSLGS